MTSTPLLVNVPHPSDLPADPNQNPWRRRSSRQVYENPWISVREDQVIRPDGAPASTGSSHFKNLAVGALAVEGEHLYLVGQYRYAWIAIRGRSRRVAAPKTKIPSMPPGASSARKRAVG